MVTPIQPASSTFPTDLQAFAETDEDGAGLTTSSLFLVPPAEGTRYWRVRDWSSNALPTPRDLFLYLPEAYYREPDRAFPVLLLHDGQNLFDGELSYVKGSTW